MWVAWSLPMVGEGLMDTTKARRCIQLLTYSYTKNTHSFNKAVLVSCHVIKNQEISFTMYQGLESRMESGWVFQLACYMFGATTKLSVLFHVLRLWFTGT